MNSNFLLLGALGTNQNTPVKTEYLEITADTPDNKGEIRLYDNLSDVGNSNYFATIHGDNTPQKVSLDSHTNKIYAFIWLPYYESFGGNHKYNINHKVSDTIGCTVKKPSNGGYDGVPNNVIWEIDINSTQKVASLKISVDQYYIVGVTNSYGSEGDLMMDNFYNSPLRPGESRICITPSPAIMVYIQNTYVYNLYVSGSDTTQIINSGGRAFVYFNTDAPDFNPYRLGITATVRLNPDLEN